MSHWYFGQHAGIDFSSGQAVVVNDGQLSSWEASSTISDADGNLLFYTNGRTVWNAQHEVMGNGTMLLGDESALKGTLIVPLPDSRNSYHILTTAGQFRYHVVDMDLENGLGAVVLKNQEFPGRTTESLAGALHCNKNDYWILTRGWNNEDPFYNDTMHFHVRRMDAQGLGAPTIQTFHFGPGYKTMYDHPTFSPSGDLLCYSTLSSNVYLFDFDTYTGTLTFRDSLSFNWELGNAQVEKVYSTEFSPDETKLYVSYWKQLEGWTFVAQYDLTAADINASKVILDSIPIPPGIQYAWPCQGRLQVAPDGRIYSSRFRSVGQVFVRDTLDAILHPNLAGTAATYQRNALPLNGGMATCGLPAFLNSYALPDVGAPDCPMTTGIAEPGPMDLSIHPNPASDHWFTIGLGNGIPVGSRIIITDLAGAQVMEITAHGGSAINVQAHGLAAGVYLVSVQRNAQPGITRKVVLE